MGTARRIVAMLVGAGLLGLAPGVACAAVRVERVDALAASAVPDLRSGDRLLAVVDARGTRTELRRALDWTLAEIERMPAGPLSVVRARDGAEQRVTVPAGRVRLVVAAAEPESLDADARALDAAYAGLALALASEVFATLEPAWRALEALPEPVDRADRVAVALLHAEAAIRMVKADAAIKRLEALALPDPATSAVEATAWGRLGNARAFAGGKPVEQVSAVQVGARWYETHAPLGVGHAELLRFLAIVEAYGGRLDDARRDAEQSVRATAACDDCVVRSRALQGRGVTESLRDQPAAAIATSGEAIALLDRLPDPPRVEIAAHLSTLSHSQLALGQYRDAAHSAQRLLEIARSPRGRPRDLIIALNRLGLNQQALGRAGEAIAAWSEALALVRSVEPGSFSEYNPTLHLGNLYLELGDLGNARVQYAAALRILDQRKQNPSARALLQFDLGRLETAAGDHAAAEREVREGLRLAEQINPASTSTSQGWVQLGVLLGLAQQPDQAEEALARARAIDAQLPDDCYCRVPALRESGWLELARSRAEVARGHFAKALTEIEQHQGGPYDRAQVLNGLGEAERVLGRREPARKALVESIALLRDYSPDSAPLARALAARGRLAIDESDAAGSREAWCAAADVLDRASGRVGGDSIALAQFRSQYAEVYRSCLEAELRLKRTEAAFAVLERSRSRSFLDAIEQRAPVQAGSADGDGLARWLENQRHRRTLIEALGDARLANDRREALRRELVQLGNEDGDARRRLASGDPVLAALLVPGGSPLAALRKALPPKAALVSYSLGERNGHVFVLDAMSLVVRELPLGRVELAARVDRLRALVARRQAGDLPAIESESIALHAALFAPIADRLGANVPRLLIAPDGPLHELPFALLREGAGGRTLIERHALQLVDSATSYAALARRATATGSGVLGVAAESEGTANPLRTGVAAALPALPAARDEVRALAELHPGQATLLLGPEATERALGAAAPKAGVLHFAVHALADRSRLLDSALVLAPDAAARAPQDDGLLHLWEILSGPRLNASLAVLSGCETGVGRELRGEGLIGFTRVFEIAGANAVLASLWPVQDRKAQQLMARFYRERERLGDDALALRAAILAGMGATTDADGDALRGVGGLSARVAPARDVPLPFDWAVFQLYGAGRQGRAR